MNKPKINDSYNDKKSYVAKDQIWKDHVTKSTLSARKWPEIWGFMHETDTRKQPKKMTKTSKEFNSVAMIEPASSKLDKSQSTHVDLPPSISSPSPVPKTTAGMIGWRSTSRITQLEKFGPYTKGKFSINKSLNWPDDSI